MEFTGILNKRHNARHTFKCRAIFLCPSFVYILNNRLLYGKIGRIEYETEGVKATFLSALVKRETGENPVRTRHRI
jgi:hypothetical protein